MKNATTDISTSTVLKLPKLNSNEKNCKGTTQKKFRFQAKSNRTTIYPDTSQDISYKYNTMSCKSNKKSFNNNNKAIQVLQSESDNDGNEEHSTVDGLMRCKPILKDKSQTFVENYQTITSKSSCNQSKIEKIISIQNSISKNICSSTVNPSNSLKTVSSSLSNGSNSSSLIISPKLPQNSISKNRRNKNLSSSFSYMNDNNTQIKSSVEYTEFEVISSLNNRNTSKQDLWENPNHKKNFEKYTAEDCSKYLSSKKTIVSTSSGNSTPPIIDNCLSLASTQTYISSCESLLRNEVPEKLTKVEPKDVFEATPSFLSSNKISVDTNKLEDEIEEKSFTVDCKSPSCSIDLVTPNSPHCHKVTAKKNNFIVLSPLSDNQNESFSEKKLPLTKSCKLNNCQNSTMIEGRSHHLVENTFVNCANLSSIKGFQINFTFFYLN